jgi:CheY-like chemotaxis protein
MRILLVDDDHDVLHMLAEACRLRGFEEVHVAADGLEALSLLDRHDVDVVVSDFQMPNMNGMGLSVAIQATRPELPVYILTGLPGEERPFVPSAQATFAKSDVDTALDEVAQRTRERLACAKLDAVMSRGAVEREHRQTPDLGARGR